MEINTSTLLKANLHVAVVTQSGMSFLCNDIKNGTSGKIQNREVGACYIKARLRHNCATEFHIQNVTQLLNIVDSVKAFKLTAKQELLSRPSGLRNSRKEFCINELLQFVTNENRRCRENNSQNRIKISPYSIMIKITLQHFVPLDIKDTMKYPDRYVKNNADYSSNQQVFELRIPLVPKLDSEDEVEAIFNYFKSFLESLKPTVILENARSTRLSLENLVGHERYKAIVTKENESIDVIVEDIQQNTTYDYTQDTEDNDYHTNEENNSSEVTNESELVDDGDNSDTSKVEGEYPTTGF